MRPASAFRRRRLRGCAAKRREAGCFGDGWRSVGCDSARLQSRASLQLGGSEGKRSLSACRRHVQPPRQQGGVRQTPSRWGRKREGAFEALAPFFAQRTKQSLSQETRTNSRRELQACEGGCATAPCGAARGRRSADAGRTRGCRQRRSGRVAKRLKLLGPEFAFCVAERSSLVEWRCGGSVREGR